MPKYLVTAWCNDSVQNGVEVISDTEIEAVEEGSERAMKGLPDGEYTVTVKKLSDLSI